MTSRAARRLPALGAIVFLITLGVVLAAQASENGTGGVMSAAAGSDGQVHPSELDATPPHVRVITRKSRCVIDELRIKVIATDASPVASVDYSIDGEKIIGSLEPPYAVTLNVRRLGRGVHRLTVRVRDEAGNIAVVDKSFRRCEARVRPQRRIRPRLAG